jgi:hypothetical protein
VILPITKEEFAAEKERLMAINAKAPKKVKKLPLYINHL